MKMSPEHSKLRLLRSGAPFECALGARTPQKAARIVVLCAHSPEEESDTQGDEHRGQRLLSHIGFKVSLE
jgi:hypothetical protein